MQTAVGRGIAYLGSFTFYRAVDGTRNVLVRFDEKHYWHTGFDKAFEELAQQVTQACCTCCKLCHDLNDHDPLCLPGCLQPTCELKPNRL